MGRLYGEADDRDVDFSLDAPEDELYTRIDRDEVMRLFINLIENYLNTLENTGLLVQFKAKWFSDGSWIAELP